MSPSRTSVLELDRPSPLRRTLTTSRRQNNFDSTLIAEPTEEKIVALEKVCLCVYLSACVCECVCLYVSVLCVCQCVSVRESVCG